MVTTLANKIKSLIFPLFSIRCCCTVIYVVLWCQLQQCWKHL